jgi:hypothetical protein
MVLCQMWRQEQNQQRKKNKFVIGFGWQECQHITLTKHI